MKTVTFHGFANGHQAFAEVLPYATSGNIARIAKKRGKLASKIVTAQYDAPRKGSIESDTGVIYSGVRIAAHFTVSSLPFYLNSRESA